MKYRHIIHKHHMISRALLPTHTHRDNVISFGTSLPSSVGFTGGHLPSRRLAVCKPAPPPAPLLELIQATGRNPSNFVVVTESQGRFKTKQATRKLSDSRRCFEDGWSMLRDRALYLELDCRDGAPLQQRQGQLEKLLSRSRADYLLYVPQHSFALSHQLKHLDELGSLQEEQRVLLSVMRDPVGYNASHSPLPIKIGDLGRPTVSQQQAADLIQSQVCTLVRGPPGTGKTEFLARMLLALENLQGGRALLVGVTAQQRSGVATLINRLARSALEGVSILAFGSGADTWSDCPLHERVEQHVGSQLGSDFYPHFRQLLKTQRLVVVSGTVWQLNKLWKAVDEPLSKDPTFNTWDPAFDMVVVDEASQMPVVAASCVVQRVRTLEGSHGRLVFVGDEHQLPPVIKGLYSERNDAYKKYYTDYAAYLPSLEDEDR
jgi:hypothetical protein